LCESVVRAIHVKNVFSRAVPNDKHGDTQPAAILDLLPVEKRELQTAHHTNRAKQKRPEF